MGKGRILYVNQEIVPFSSENEQASLGRYLPAKLQEMGREIRVFMPKFCDVNDRKHQLHEVIRLSGMNLIVNNCDHQLIIKVGSIPTARMQVYFIDNDEYAIKGSHMVDNKNRTLPDTDERLLFFGRGTLEAVRKLAWQPHLINFSGWMTSMVPFYLRRINKENAFFSGTKMIVTLVDDRFEGPIGGDLERKMKTDNATAKDLRLYGQTDYLGLMKAAITYSHGVIIGSANVHPELVAFAKENKRNVLDYVEDPAEFYPRINKFYDTIVGISKFEN
ncbi:MAG: glycogen/starch synthase [Bacteroidales bacterium]|nr:glycogen/starch synthase [Bacteroidales bacterium]